MTALDVPRCQCSRCRGEGDHPDRVLHQQMNLLLSRLDEAQRRWYVAVEANRLGQAACICSPRSPAWTRRRSGADAKNWPPPWPSAHPKGCAARRWPAGGRKKDPAIVPALVEPETAGDPMSDQKWVRSSLRQLSSRLGEPGTR